MKVIITLAVIALCAGQISAHLRRTVNIETDQCEPDPTCHQCINGVFPADLCCRDVKTYYKLNLANAEDCSSYYSCVNDHAILRQCPEGLNWSIESDRCESPEIAQCKVKISDKSPA